MTLEQHADPTIDPATYYLLDPFLGFLQRSLREQ